MPIEQTPISCTECGKRAYLQDNDLDDDDADPQTPPNWVRIVATRVVENPAFVAEHNAFEEEAVTQRQALEEAIASGQVPAEHADLARQQMEFQIEGQKTLLTEIPHRVEVIEEILCDDHGHYPQTRLSFPDWTEAEEAE